MDQNRGVIRILLILSLAVAVANAVFDLDNGYSRRLAAGPWVLVALAGLAMLWLWKKKS